MTGVLIFKGMTVGFQPGDFVLETDGAGNVTGRAILSTAYNVLPLWLKVAADQLVSARTASLAIKSGWGHDDDANRKLLVAEVEPSMQVFVACGVAFDALYDQLRPFSRISQTELKIWRENKTARAKQIAEVIRRTYGLDKTIHAQFAKNISNIVGFRDKAVHPSLALQQACTRPDVPVGVDWKFAAYRHHNADICFRSTMEMLNYLCSKKSPNATVNQQMGDVLAALEELGVIKVKPASPHASD